MRRDPRIPAAQETQWAGLVHWLEELSAGEAAPAAGSAAAIAAALGVALLIKLARRTRPQD
ncbi:MAG: cyclodeaminase/cyclohydrolase family protein, partial [Anaerolineae bacterium]|nr:cyclodeaminase/cyclohydrolase family protein [Anaerolineae bacterium]